MVRKCKTSEIVTHRFPITSRCKEGIDVTNVVLMNMEGISMIFNYLGGDALGIGAMHSTVDG